jgi:hypothetical protein
MKAVFPSRGFAGNLFSSGYALLLFFQWKNPLPQTMLAPDLNIFSVFPLNSSVNIVGSSILPPFIPLLKTLPKRFAQATDLFADFLEVLFRIF